MILFFSLSCEKRKEEKVACDKIHLEEWDNVFVEASKCFEIGEIKKVVLENPCDANQCVVIRGGSDLAGTDFIYNEYLENQIPEAVAKKLVHENIGEGVALFFLNDNTIISSIKLVHISSKDYISFKKIGERITFSIRLPPQLTEKIKNDPNFLDIPEFGQDYLTNPNRPKPIEIMKME